MKFEDIVLRRGKVADPAFWTWIKQVQDGKIDEARKNGSIVLYDYAHGEVSRFNFEAGLAVEGRGRQARRPARTRCCSRR